MTWLVDAFAALLGLARRRKRETHIRPMSRAERRRLARVVAKNFQHELAKREHPASRQTAR